MIDSHLVFAAPPAPGHVYPTLPLVERLVARGHRVTYLTSPALRNTVLATGAEVAELDWENDTSDLTEFTAETLVATLEEFLTVSRQALPGLLARFCADPPDLVCFDSVLLGPLLAGTFGVPLVALVSTFANNEHFEHAQLVPGSDQASSAFAAYGAKVADLFAANDVPMGAAEPDLSVVFLPREFQIAGDTFKDTYRFVGPSPSRAREESWRPPDGEAPMLLVSLGTAFNNRPEFFASWVEAFRDSRWQIVITVGQHVDPATLGPAAANVEIAAHLPQHAVLEHATAFVTHAGMGSVMEALYHRVPILVVPQVHEQSVNADRVVELGLGARLSVDPPTPAALRGQVERLAADSTMRANLAAMRKAIDAAGGAETAALAIERHLSCQER